MGDLIYRPDDIGEPIAQYATLGVRFSTDIFLMKSFLDHWEIRYKEEDLEDGPMGLGITIKKGENGNDWSKIGL